MEFFYNIAFFKAEIKVNVYKATFCYYKAILISAICKDELFPYFPLFSFFQISFYFFRLVTLAAFYFILIIKEAFFVF